MGVRHNLGLLASVILLASACGESKSPLDQEVEKIWLDLARTGRYLDFCDRIDDGVDSRSLLESGLAEDYELDPDQASDALDQIEQRCAAGAD